MRRTVRQNIILPYSLHDMTVTAFDVRGNDVVMRTQTGMTEVGTPCRQVKGWVEFRNVQWDFSYAYLLGINGNEGRFSGEKLPLKTFFERYGKCEFSVIDETYGYNMTKYSGFLMLQEQFNECSIEFYHEGDMVFVTEE